MYLSIMKEIIIVLWTIIQVIYTCNMVFKALILFNNFSTWRYLIFIFFYPFSNWYNCIHCSHTAPHTLLITKSTNWAISFKRLCIQCSWHSLIRVCSDFGSFIKFLIISTFKRGLKKTSWIKAISTSYYRKEPKRYNSFVQFCNDNDYS